MPSSFATLAIGRDVSITIFTASSLNSGEKLFFGRGKTLPFQVVHPNRWTVRKVRGTSAVAGGADGGGVPGRRGGCRHCHSHIRVSGSQVCGSQDGAPHSGRESRERSQV